MSGPLIKTSLLSQTSLLVQTSLLTNTSALLQTGLLVNGPGGGGTNGYLLDFSDSTETGTAYFYGVM